MFGVIAATTGDRRIHNALEEHVKEAFCPRCRRQSSEGWKSEFWNTLHYVTTTCTHCEYKIFYRSETHSCGVEK